MVREGKDFLVLQPVRSQGGNTSLHFLNSISWSGVAILTQTKGLLPRNNLGFVACLKNLIRSHARKMQLFTMSCESTLLDGQQKAFQNY